MGSKQQKQQNPTRSANCLQKVSLWLHTVASFKLKLKVMFCVQSFRTARTHLGPCWCWEIYIFTCWMCKVDHCKLKIATSCHSPSSVQIWWATQQSWAPNEYACSILSNPALHTESLATPLLLKFIYCWHLNIFLKDTGGLKHTL